MPGLDLQQVQACSPSLFDNKHSQETLTTSAKQCRIKPDDIEDIYPCTAAQEGLFALSVKNPNTYVARYVYSLPHDIDVARFESAIVSTMEAHTILRTRLVQAGLHGTLQVVLRQPVDIARADDLNAYLAADSQQPMPPGSPLIRIAIVTDQKKSENLVITIHHALYDDWSLNVVLHDIEAAYNGKILSRRAFADFTELSLRAQSGVSAQKWQSQLQGLSTAQFPRLPSSSYTPAAKGSLINHVYFPAGMGEVQQSAVINLAWGMLLAQYTGSRDVVFGLTLTGRRACLPGIEYMSGPTIATIPLRVDFAPETKVADALKCLLDNGDEMLPFEQRGLYNISRLGPEAAAACQFQNLVVIQSPPQYQYEYLREKTQELDLQNHATFGTYGITLVCDLRKDAVRVQAVYDEHVVPPAQMQRILNQLNTLIQRLTESSDSTIAAIDSLGTQDLEELKRWNGSPPPKTEECMHDLILRQCHAQPESPAVAACDGQFTYSELDALSARLSISLLSRGIGPESFVPVYFEKSKWTTVAIMAVMRAGAAFVLLDPSNPLSRNESICRKVNASCILTSQSLAASAEALAKQIIPVHQDASSVKQHGNAVQPDSQKVTPSNLLYAVFTSGSTGTPKGVQIEHASFVTSAMAYISTSQMTNETRALQFASYAFDVSISDTLVTLAAGGCICVPSEEERKSELAAVVASYNVNWADLTPSLLRHLQPEQFPSLRTVTLGGEPMSQSEIDTWGPHVRLLNVYGPAECCVLSTVQANVTRTTDPRDIGYATGGVCWIVDPADYNRLMPIGAVGELLIEGTIVGRGYLADPQKTAAAFIESSPAWMQNLRPNAPSTRFYRTGDLVQYTPQGSLRYIGRKDMQVKLRGQRLELEEVEFHVSNAFRDAEGVVADVIAPPALDGRPQLIAFVLPKDREQPSDGLFLPPTKDFHEAVAAATAYLRQAVPAFMVPSTFLPITHVLRTVSDKIDRRRLREAAAALSREEMESYRQQNAASIKRVPVSASARRLQAIWAHILDIPADRIGLDDGFFELGGDSITAMKVASMAKSQGLSLSVSDLFQNSSLESIASATMTQASANTIYDWEAETDLESDLVLTGCTGFLGQQILRQLIEDPRVGRIHCVAVRTQGKGVGRQSALLQSDKVIVHPGDLSLPNLGIEEERLSQILENCCAIIHCGADISFVKNYELLKDTNVRATRYLARLAVRNNVPIHYASSAALSHFTGLQSLGEISLRSFPPPIDGESGYLTSKWVSEVCLEKCSKTYGLPVTVHRISSIVGPDAPAMDITNSVLNFARTLRATPDLSSCKGYIDIIGLETVAANIIADALNPTQPTSISYVNESGEIRVPACQLKSYLERETGETFRDLQLSEWIDAARKCGMPELVANFLGAMPPSEIDIAMPFLRTSRMNGKAVLHNPSLPVLPTRALGRDGPQVTGLGFGAMPLSVFYLPRPTDEERLKLLDQVYAMGLTHWDSADCYGDNEEILGKWFARTGRRNDIFLASKFAVTSEDGGATWIVRNDAAYVRKACDESLRKLGVDTIDLYYCHRMSGETPIEETVAEMVQLKNEGKIRYLGLSECSADTLRRACKVHHITAVQVEYSPFSLDIEEPTINLLATCRELGVAVVAYSPLGRGFLAGKIKSIDDIPEGDVRRSLPRFLPENFDKNLRLADTFDAMARSKNVPVAALVLAWLMRQGEDIFPVPGSTKIRNIEQNLLAFRVEFTEDELKTIRTALRSIGVAGDRYPEGGMALFGDTPPLRN